MKRGDLVVTDLWNDPIGIVVGVVLVDVVYFKVMCKAGKVRTFHPSWLRRCEPEPTPMVPCEGESE